MFQSVTPRPGKVPFQLEPFPAPSIELVPETEVSQLPVAEPVSVFVPDVVEAELPAEKEEIAVESPFLMASDVEPEARALTPLAELVSTLMAEEDGPEDIDDEDDLIPMDSTPESPQFNPEELKEFEEGKEVFSEVFPQSESVEKSGLQESEEKEESVFGEVSPVSVFAPAPEPVAVEVLAPVDPNSPVQTWQPPASSKGKKNARFGAFFR